MKIYNNIVSVFLIVTLTLLPLARVSATDVTTNTYTSYAQTNYLEKKNALAALPNGEKYIQTIDALVEKIKNNPEKIEKIQGKIQKATSKLMYKYDLTKNEKRFLAILQYLSAKIDLIDDAIQQEKERKVEMKYNVIMRSVENSGISEADQKKFNDSVVTIQKNIVKTYEDKTLALLDTFDSFYNYENKGDLDVTLNIESSENVNIDAGLSVSDYVIQNSNFDARFTGDITTFFKSEEKEEIRNVEISKFIDFISKDGNFYLLLKDLKIVNENNTYEVESILSLIEKFSQKNKYIHFQDKESQEALEYIKSFNPKALFGEMYSYAEQPMFQAYKKEGNTYTILPSKYACDTFKQLANKFDPFSPGSCTQGQYKDMIKSIVSTGEMTLTLGRNDIFHYSIKDEGSIGEIEVVFNSKEIKKVDISLVDTSNLENKLSINYEKNKQCNVVLHADDIVSINFESKLDRRNNFSYIKHNAKIKDYSSTTQWNYNLNNRKIDGDFTLKTLKNKYDYETGEYTQIDGDTYTAKVTGKTDSLNKIKQLSFHLNNGTTSDEKLNMDINYDLPNLAASLSYDDSSSTVDLDFEGKWNSYNKNLDSFKFSTTVDNKEKVWDSVNYTMNPTGEINRVFEMDYSLSNKKINGAMSAYKGKSDLIFQVETDGTFETKKLDLNNIITVDKNLGFNSQMTSLRDSIRISDIYSLTSAVETYYQDMGEYPSVENFHEVLSGTYINTIPTDPSGNIEINGCKFGYHYSVADSEYGIPNSVYLLSTCLESENSYAALHDGGVDLMKFEKGHLINDIHTENKESFYIQNYKTWEKVSPEETKNPEIEVNFGYDHTLNKSNFNIFVHSKDFFGQIMTFDLKNIGTIEYKDIEINIPTDTIDFDDAMNDY